MFCPTCGQQQASAEIRFCSRCGLPLELISEIVANGGSLPRLDELSKKKKWLTRINVLKFGLIWMTFWWFVVAAIGAIAELDGLPELGGVLGFAGIIFSLLIAFVFLDKEQPAQSQNVNFRSDEMQNLRGAARQNALPPQQSVPASSYIPPQPGGWKTNDLTAPGSVTERTTKLLSEDEK
jgi:hypothetical protein